MKECSACGMCLELSDFHLKKNGSVIFSECKKCRRAKVNRERREVKIQVIEYMGGKCAHCELIDIPEVYDLHHVDPSKKEYNIALLLRRKYTLEQLFQELAKCILLCANCHRKVHAIINT